MQKIMKNNNNNITRIRLPVFCYGYGTTHLPVFIRLLSYFGKASDNSVQFYPFSTSTKSSTKELVLYNSGSENNNNTYSISENKHTSKFLSHLTNQITLLTNQDRFAYNEEFQRL